LEMMALCVLHARRKLSVQTDAVICFVFRTDSRVDNCFHVNPLCIMMLGGYRTLAFLSREIEKEEQSR